MATQIVSPSDLQLAAELIRDHVDVRVNNKLDGFAPSSTGIPEAPDDGQQYARQNETWTPVETSGDCDTDTRCTCPILNRFRGKKLAVLGDSISATSDSSIKLWSEWVRELLEMSELVSYAKGGAQITKRSGDTNSFHDQFDLINSDNPDVDLICVFGGTNDWGKSVPVGIIGDASEYVFTGAVESLIKKLIGKFPTKEIVFFVPMQRTNDTGGDKPAPLTTYNDIIMLLCGKYAIPVYDTYHAVGMSRHVPAQWSHYVSSDGVHPNNNGHEKLGRAFTSFLISPTFNMVTPTTIVKQTDVIGEAPADGEIYGRQNRSWVHVGEGTPSEPPDQFKLLIDTGQTNTAARGTSTDFILPTCNAVNGKSYDWIVDWGDGVVERYTNAGNEDVATAPGIPHNYPSVGEYTITIKPAIEPTPGRWLRAFGNAIHSYTVNAGASANRRKIVAPLSPINPLMLINDFSNINESSLFENWFSACDGYNFHLGENFGLTPEWDEITTLPSVSTWFRYMFRTSSIKEIPASFRLPQGLEQIGNQFCESMFWSSKLTAVPEHFILPPSLYRVGTNGFRQMFGSCTNLVSLPAGFTIPPITQMGTGFLDAMFDDCPLLILPAGFRFPILTGTQLNQTNVFANTFRVTANKSWAAHPVTANQILGTMASMIPSGEKGTFRTGSDLANSQGYGASRWGSGFAGLDNKWK
jgi:lysophospholipase L1-like esterase